MVRESAEAGGPGLLTGRRALIVGVAATVAVVLFAVGARSRVDESSEQYGRGVLIGAEEYGAYVSLTDRDPQGAQEFCEGTVERNQDTSGTSRSEIRDLIGGCVAGAECTVDIEEGSLDDLLTTGSPGTYSVDCSSAGKSQRKAALRDGQAVANGESGITDSDAAEAHLSSALSGNGRTIGDIECAYDQVLNDGDNLECTVTFDDGEAADLVVSVSGTEGNVEYEIDVAD